MAQIWIKKRCVMHQREEKHVTMVVTIEVVFVMVVMMEMVFVQVVIIQLQ